MVTIPQSSQHRIYRCEKNCRNHATQMSGFLWFYFIKIIINDYILRVFSGAFFPLSLCSWILLFFHDSYQSYRHHGIHYCFCYLIITMTVFIYFDLVWWLRLLSLLMYIVWFLSKQWSIWILPLCYSLLSVPAAASSLSSLLRRSQEILSFFWANLLEGKHMLPPGRKEGTFTEISKT